MKIGIITFHWATNYGAILQSFALQTVLTRMGHDVEIIDYKPKQYEPSLWRFIRRREFLHPRTYLNGLKKEETMKEFRCKYLKCTKRYYSIKELQSECNEFDVLISGSDQVMNPSFLVGGERGGSTAYFLDFGRNDAKRMTYAVSFGVTLYPPSLLSKTKPLVSRFDALSVRETTGMDIFRSMGRDDAVVVPDPTLLLKAVDYDKTFGIEDSGKKGVSVYMLHNRLSAISSKLPKDAHIITSESIEGWLASIKNSEHLITNSFHGMVFALHYHVPFTIVLQSTINEGMNDRFYTLLGAIGLTDRMVSEKDFKVNEETIDWGKTDILLNEAKQVGYEFLTHNLSKDAIKH